MEDRFRYAAVRQRIINAMKTDLMGPLAEEEVLDENPRHAYVIGLLAPQTDLSKGSEDDTLEQEIESVITYEDGEDYTAGEDDDNEPITTTHFQLPSSIGISFYIKSDTDRISLDLSWGDYAKSAEKVLILRKDSDESDFGGRFHVLRKIP